MSPGRSSGLVARQRSSMRGEACIPLLGLSLLLSCQNAGGSAGARDAAYADVQNTSTDLADAADAEANDMSTDLADAADADVDKTSIDSKGCDGVSVTTPSDCAAPPDCPSMGSASPSVLATRLSRFLWNQENPGEDLLADVAKVNSASDMKSLAIRMMADSRARDGLSAFFRNWLRLDDLGTIQKPDGIMTPDLVASMQKEAPAFGVSIVFDGDGRYESLMLAPFTFVDQTLAAHYGIAGVTGAEMRKVDYPDSARVGILEGAGVLARYADAQNPPWPPRRFWLMYETMLCDSGVLPAAAVGSSKTEGLTIRQDLEMRTSVAPCNGCHVTVNPIGLAFSDFDTFGRYWPFDETGSPFQTSATVAAGLTLTASVAFDDSSDLIRQLALRPEIRRCFAARVLDYALHPATRSASAPIDRLPLELQCSLDKAQASFESSGGSIPELIEAITATPAFIANTSP